MIKRNNFYQISNDYQILLNDLYDHETGEVNELIEQKIEALFPDVEKKCVSIGTYIKTLKSEKLQIEEVKKEISLREKAYDREIGRMEEYLKANMERCNITKVQCPYFTIKLSKNPWSVDVYNEDIIPGEFMRTREVTKIEVKPDKKAIIESFVERGECVPGAEVARKTKLTITVDKI